MSENRYQQAQEERYERLSIELRRSRPATAKELDAWQRLCEQFASLGGMCQAYMSRRRS